MKITATLCFIFVCSNIASAQWTSELPTVGTFSSIRVSDLNLDGISDIVIGSGRAEFQACDSAVVAINGLDGSLLWTVSSSDQMFGSAIFQDIDGDLIEDVFIGGRSAELIAISGRSGNEIWRFRSANPNDTEGWYNFYNPQWIPDQNQDGILDMIVSNGGDVHVAPHDPDRPAGLLVVLDGKTGRIISKAFMPDQKETYMSVNVSPLPDSSDYEIVFGTGGETIGGSLYIDLLTHVLSGDLSAAIALDSSLSKGYIGPAVRVDLTGDGILDIVASAVDGRAMCIDGDSYQKLWEVSVPNAESYNSASIGYYNADDIPDVFVSMGSGTWPKLTWGVQKMIDGQTGHVLFEDSLGFYQNASPLSADLNGDGIEEIIMSINFQEVDSLHRKSFYTALAVKEFASGDLVFVSDIFEGSNLSSTPWIGDLDHDGYLDILYCHGTNLNHTYTFDGIKLHLLRTTITLPKSYWGAYQGNNYKAQFIRDFE